MNKNINKIIVLILFLFIFAITSCDLDPELDELTQNFISDLSEAIKSDIDNNQDDNNSRAGAQRFREK